MLTETMQAKGEQLSRTWQLGPLVRQAREVIGRMIKSIFGSNLGVTTVLLMVIWFANALTYYGEVLLTVTVSHQHQQSFRAMSESSIALRSSEA